MNKTIFRGVLENAGLSEVGYYLKKAKDMLARAEYSLSNTSFDEITSKSSELKRKIANLHNTIVEIDEDIDSVVYALATAAENIEESEEEKES